LTRQSRAYYLYLKLAGALGLPGDLAKAQTALAEAMRLNPNSIHWPVTARFSMHYLRDHWALRDKTLNPGLRAGFPDE
jgi:hypothetical protein